MNAAKPQQPEPLQAQVDQALEKLGGLERNLHAIKGELDALAVQREQHMLLEQACGSLEKLSELGVQNLFWGDGHEPNRLWNVAIGVRIRTPDASASLDDRDGDEDQHRLDISRIHRSLPMAVSKSACAVARSIKACV